MKPMSDFTTDLQHSGMPAKNLDETIEFYTQKLGFDLVGIFHNGENRCAFLRYGHLTIETWEGDPVAMKDGAINHWRSILLTSRPRSNMRKFSVLTLKTKRSNPFRRSGTTEFDTSTFTVRIVRSSNSARLSDLQADALVTRLRCPYPCKLGRLSGALSLRA